MSASIRQYIQRSDYSSALDLLQSCREDVSDTLPATDVDYMLTTLLENITVRKLLPQPRLDSYLKLLRSLLQLYPRAAFAKNLLHRACGFQPTSAMLSIARDECIRIILEEVPDASQVRSEHNWLPIHFACFNNISFEILQRLVEAAPETVLCETSGGTTALNILWDRYAMSDFPYRCIFSSLNDEIGVDLWRKIMLLVEVAYSEYHHFRCHNYNPLIALASIPHTTVEMMTLALTKYQDLVTWKDDSSSGDNLLHASGKFNRAQSHQAHCSNKDMVIAILKMDPSLAHLSNKQGRYPLMIAVLSGFEWDDGLSDIFQAFPGAATIQDAECKLFPFMAAQSISTMFCILREGPEVIKALSNQMRTLRNIKLYT